MGKAAALGLARRAAVGPAARLDRLVTTSVQSRELVWGGEGWTEAVRVQETHRLGRLAALRRIRSSRRWAGRAGSCSRLLARLPSGGSSSHGAPVLLARAAKRGIVSWGGQAVTRRYWVPCTCVRLDTGFRDARPKRGKTKGLASGIQAAFTTLYVYGGCYTSGRAHFCRGGRVIHCRSSTWYEPHSFGRSLPGHY